jgi:hypothetical protein
MNISKLHEKVTLLELNDVDSDTTVGMYNEIINVRASVRLAGQEKETKLLEFVLLKPPEKFKTKQIAAIRWNGIDYELKGILKNYGDKCLKCTTTQPS